MKLYGFGKAVTYLLVRLFFSMRYEGLENIPKEGGFILACNHRSNFDPLVIAHKMPHPIHYLAKEELTKPPVIGSIIRALGVIPIKRGAGDTDALDQAAETLRAGGVLGMFPEGHRSRDGKPLRPKSGVSLIAAKTGADVLPCAVCFGKKLGFRARITVRYAPPIPFEELGVDLEAPSTIRTATRKIMDEILALGCLPEENE